MTIFAPTPDREVNSLIEHTGYAVAALTLLPIPGSEILGVMPLHVGMVIGIAHHHGRELTRETAMELVLQIGTTVGLSLVGTRIATTAAKIVLPGLGGLVAAPFLFAGTLALGAVADAYFRANGELGADEMRRVYRDARSAARKAYQAERVGDEEFVGKAREAVKEDATAEAGGAQEDLDLVARLRRAKEMHGEGLLDDDEFAAVKERILSEL